MKTRWIIVLLCGCAMLSVAPRELLAAAAAEPAELTDPIDVCPADPPAMMCNCAVVGCGACCSGKTCGSNPGCCPTGYDACCGTYPNYTCKPDCCDHDDCPNNWRCSPGGVCIDPTSPSPPEPHEESADQHPSTPSEMVECGPDVGCGAGCFGKSCGGGYCCPPGYNKCCGTYPNNVCRAECCDATHCPTNWVCLAGHCVDPNAPAPPPENQPSDESSGETD